MTTLTIHEMPEQERPRERMLAAGPGALSDSELIAVLLRTGRQGANAVEVARELLKKFGSLQGLSRCGVQELAAVKGVGKAKAMQLVAAFGLGQRLAREEHHRARLDSPELVFSLVSKEMQQLQRESLQVILLDTRYHWIRTEQVSLGSLNESIAHPREVFRPAILYSAFAVIAVHNHPSGDPSPSEADHRLTRRLAEAAQLLQIQLLDHVIIGSALNGRKPWFSFREAGIL